MNKMNKMENRSIEIHQHFINLSYFNFLFYLDIDLNRAIAQ